MDLSKHLENAKDAVKRRNHALAIKIYGQVLQLQPDFGEARAGLRRALEGSEFLVEVRGKGLMIALELGPPRAVRLKSAYALIEKARRGLFCQLLLIPLLKEHRILAQVAGPEMPVIKLLPRRICPAWLARPKARLMP